MNKKSEYLTRFDINVPVKATFDGLQINVLEEEDSVLYEQCKKEVEEKTK